MAEDAASASCHLHARARPLSASNRRRCAARLCACLPTKHRLVSAWSRRLQPVCFLEQSASKPPTKFPVTTLSVPYKSKQSFAVLRGGRAFQASMRVESHHFLARPSRTNDSEDTTTSHQRCATRRSCCWST
eukprot:3357863-Pleurochrysis_carterae.AAC.3